MRNIVLISACPEAALKQAGFLVKHLLKNQLVYSTEIHQFSSNIQMEETSVEGALKMVNGYIPVPHNRPQSGNLKCHIFIDNSIAQNCVINEQLINLADVIILVDVSIEQITEKSVALQEEFLTKRLLLLCLADKLKWHVTMCGGKMYLDDHIRDCTHAIL